MIPADKRKPEGICETVDTEIKRRTMTERKRERDNERERRTDSRRAVQREPPLSTTSGSHQGAGRKKRWTQLKRLAPPRSGSRVLACFTSSSHLPPKDAELRREITVGENFH